MSDERVANLAERDPAQHRAVGSALCGMAGAMNAQLGPVETSRLLFSLWLSFVALYQAPEDSADFLRTTAARVEKGEHLPEANS